jgi:hypothetical protein
MMLVLSPILLIFVIITCLTVARTGQAETFLLKDGSKIEAEVLDCTPSAIFLRPATGGVRSILRDTVEVVQMVNNGEIVVEGLILDWDDTVGYTLLVDDQLVTVRDGLITSLEGTSTFPMPIEVFSLDAPLPDRRSAIFAPELRSPTKRIPTM